ncbi:MAG: DMT family transporter [Acidimicrobiales bacterium]
MVYVLALGAAFANALTSILQRMAVEDAPDRATLRLRLIAHALKRGMWLAGFGIMILSFLMQALALHLGRLTQVQPILTTELLFLVLLLGSSFGFRIGWKEWIGTIATAGGLAGFLIFASPGGGNVIPTATEWVEVGLACLGAVVVSVLLALRGSRWRRAAMFGTASAVGFAFTASLTKVASGYAANDLVSVFRHWETYGIAVCGGASLFLAQNAFHAGPIAASQSTLVMVDPLASILIGVSLFGDQLRTSSPWGPLEALSLLVLFAGALVLCRSSLVRGVKGTGADDQILLSVRWSARHRRPKGESPRMISSG